LASPANVFGRSDGLRRALGRRRHVKASGHNLQGTAVPEKSRPMSFVARLTNTTALSRVVS